jgi:hypothetical protein
MTPSSPNLVGAAAPTRSGNAVYLGGEQFPDSTPPQKPQAKLQEAALTCASPRADELRGCLIREILRAGAIGQQAVASLLDGDDAMALANLRRHWIAMRAGVAPMAAELDRLNREEAP